MEGDGGSYWHRASIPDNGEPEDVLVAEYVDRYRIVDAQGEQLCSLNVIEDRSGVAGHRYVAEWTTDMELDTFIDQLYDSEILPAKDKSASAQSYDDWVEGRAAVTGEYTDILQCHDVPEDTATFKIGEATDPYQVRWTTDTPKTDASVRLTVNGTDTARFEQVYHEFSNQDTETVEAVAEAVSDVLP